ncbi:sugar phosphate nucleotidyltransferase [Bacillus thuringiensis]|uniref:sugar phosphate nucleotidyltransferase n=1 Tax=Bacillus thuringiensis TaxID=1428 RepID=UPI000BFD9896|nr:sugar phosphate nucleotidyltransferase [Bacillus thuringiensis]PGW49181.1 glucose-1-phosphate cytidylyltransferase [Bacillus thuringiensis]
MQVVILCGGKGLRMSGFSKSIPKTLAKVQTKPIIWHLMKLYGQYSYTDFILPLGHQGDAIKKYFMEYHWRDKDLKINLSNQTYTPLEKDENWNVTCVDTGEDTMTGARIKKIEKYILDDTFMVTYGDGLADVNINELVHFHKKMGKVMTLTSVAPRSQYGILHSENGIATEFSEKPQKNEMINGGFFVCDKKIFDYLDLNSNCVLEEEPFQKLIKHRELAVYHHKGSWISIDTYKDLITANEIWHTPAMEVHHNE